MTGAPMMLRYPVFIPSKGRSDKCIAARLLEASGVEFWVVVEPDEQATYEKALGQNRVLVLPKSSRGLPYSRRWIKRHSEGAGHKWHWQLDDDVREFRRFEPTTGKFTRVEPQEAMAWTEDLVDEFSNIGLAGTTTFHFAPRVKWKVNQDIYQCVLVLNGTDLYWRDRTWEDTDFTLQTLASGRCTMAVQKYIHSTPSIGTNAGGEDVSGLTRKIRTTISLWPGLGIGIHRPGKVPKLKTAHLWRKFPQRPQRIEHP